MRVDVRDRGHIAVHPHVYTDKGVCNSCGRKRLNKKVGRNRYYRCKWWWQEFAQRFPNISRWL